MKVTRAIKMEVTRIATLKVDIPSYKILQRRTGLSQVHLRKLISERMRQIRHERDKALIAQHDDNRES